MQVKKAVVRSNMALRKKDGPAFLYDLRHNKMLLFMLLPAVVFFIIFSYLPMAGIVLAFKELDFSLGIFSSPWVGFKNFVFFFTSGKAWLVTRNTVLYNLAFIITGNLLNLIIAIVLSEMAGKFYKKVCQTLLLMPYFISWVVVNAILYNILNFEYGQMNTILARLGMERVDVYGQPEYWKYIIVIINLWKGMGYGSIVYLAAIMGIDREIYEAGDIDGASVFQQIWYITLPSLRPTIFILVLLSIGNIFRGNFDMFYQIIGNNGMLFNATDVIDTFVFRSLVQVRELGMSAAAGFYQSVLCFVILMVSNAVVRRVESDYALF
ncbi:sugar ABC transporter permease [Spirochaetia bacterium]|nr:sugar ABC transporter permease [Spirochaetia bacterium]